MYKEWVTNLDNHCKEYQIWTTMHCNQSTRQVLNVENLEGLHTGHLVALNVENCDLRPLITRVFSITDMDLEVAWLEGS